MLEKVVQDVPTQPLKTRKSNVWSTRNTSFQLSIFTIIKLQKCPEVVPICTTLVTKSQKKHSSRLIQKPAKTTQRKTQIFIENCVNFWPPFLSVVCIFSMFLRIRGPGPQFAPKNMCFTRVVFRNSHSVREWSESDPKKSQKRHPT